VPPLGESLTTITQFGHEATHRGPKGLTERSSPRLHPDS
jgi:hypothetical protein